MPFGNGQGNIQFQDVTLASGIERQGQSWGLTLYDFDGDGDPDLYQNNHQQKPVALYQNLGNGSFINIANEVFPNGVPGDFHGAVGFNYDNVGDRELFQVAGGDLGAALDNANKNNRLFVRNGVLLEDQAAPLGLQYPLGRGRMPLPFDFDNDGRLDLLYTGPARPDGKSIPTIFMQRNGVFEDLGINSGLARNVPNGAFGVLGDLNGDRRQELIYLANNPHIRVYDTSTLPLTDITSTLLPSSEVKGINNVQDIAVADFNGDGFQDLLLIQQGTSSIGYRLDDPNIGRVKLPLAKTSKGLTFENAGSLSLNFQGDPTLNLPSFFLQNSIQTNNIYIGSGRYNPESLVFNLDPNETANQGLPQFTPGQDRGIFIGFDTLSNQWRVNFSSFKKDSVNFLFETAQLNPIIRTQGFKNNFKGKPDKLLTYNPQLGHFVDATAASGLANTKIAGRNVVAEDFDNDGDRDLFFVTTANTQNLPDELYENLGDGTFQKVANAAGAAGTKFGLGDAVAVADYDLDGFLDLFVTNGDVTGFDRPFLLDGRNQLFKNQGNSNHWVQIDLVGTTSNRDAVGATVYVTTPDGKRQIREQNAGVHNRTQNFSRLHFGLGEQTQISQIEVYWPSGISQVFENVAVDQILEIEENNPTITPLTPPTANPTARLQLFDDALETSGSQGKWADENLEAKNQQILLKGYGGNDTLIGNQENNRIVGGKGTDLLIGNAGADQFIFYAPQHGGDRIEDFVSQVDQIVVSHRGFQGLSPGDLPRSQFVLGQNAQNGGDRFIYDQQQGQLWFDPDGSGQQSAYLIAQFRPGVLVRFDDIQVI